jgi:hypothetical protein
MSGPITLRYARSPERWTRRRRILLGLVLVFAVSASSLGFFVYRTYQRVIRPRMQFLNSQRWLRPIDWGTVAVSPTLRRLAWKFSSDPTAMDRFALDPSGVAGVSLFGTDRESVELAVQPPLAHVDGELRVSVAARNDGRNKVLIPAFEWRTSTGPESIEFAVRPASSFADGQVNVGLLEGAARDVEALIPTLEFAHSASATFQMSGWFSSSASVVAPGATETFVLSFPAPDKPVSTAVDVLPGLLNLGYFSVRICAYERQLASADAAEWILSGRVPNDMYKAWEDVPASAVDIRWRDPLARSERPRRPSRLPGRYLPVTSNGELLPPALFPDERRPKPWETDGLREPAGASE